MEQGSGQKLIALQEYLASLGSVAIAFSGGVDSSFLLEVARRVLGDKAVAITASSSAFPSRETQEAAAFCKAKGIRQVTFSFAPLAVKEFRHNVPDRCYFCKKNLFQKILDIAGENSIQYVCEGSNMDDMGDYRPGLRAIKELGIKSPLKHCSLYKEEIRQLSKALGLESWDKSSFACLASRIPYLEEISEMKLGMVEQAEQLLLDSGFKQFRVRLHGGNLARIEVLPQELEKLLKLREKVTTKLKEIGFKYVSADLAGYRTGSMNEVLSKEKRAGYGA